MRTGELNRILSFAECARSGHSAKFFFHFFSSPSFPEKKDFISLPSVLDLGTRQSFFFIFFLLLLFQKKRFYFFAECPISGHSAKFFFHFFLLLLSQKKYFTSLPSVKKTLGKPPLYRVFFLPSVFSAALGKDLVCRVPEKIHLANIKTLGKFDVFGSALL